MELQQNVNPISVPSVVNTTLVHIIESNSKCQSLEINPAVPKCGLMH